MPKIYLTYLSYPSQKGGGANFFGIQSIGTSGNGYLIKDVQVNIRIKLKSLPDTTKSKIQNKQWTIVFTTQNT